MLQCASIFAQSLSVCVCVCVCVCSHDSKRLVTVALAAHSLDQQYFTGVERDPVQWGVLPPLKEGQAW